MKPEPSTFSVVVVGSWNQSIFTSPDWIADKVFGEPGKQIEMMFPVGDPSLPIKVKVDSLDIHVQSSRIEAYAGEYSPDGLNQAILFVKNSLDLLEHTPIRALGFNLGFSDEGDTEIRNLYSFEDNGRIDSDTFHLKHTSITRSYGLTDGGSLNLTVGYDPDKTILKFNYHFEATETAVALSLLGDRDGAYWYDRTEEFLRAVFNKSIDDIEEEAS